LVTSSLEREELEGGGRGRGIINSDKIRNNGVSIWHFHSKKKESFGGNSSFLYSVRLGKGHFEEYRD
jgi:hypothetical protein